ncbi:hypothetical protein SPRG_01267 [Saprolegnia parasitica CBS 223.65]|uniref:Cyclic nucleotide-binding domain-containing protein n=1 Tax=Saprolegnia parasitica (strain CBS 223.65) TaxID=695850 RepID=A0A067CTZ2_SAPPC|nr:hypothetical protein SPRG_01267 [Saprolegnia parasitica CBS 223.65]KDO33993.1 hypothetical protein SPRG_01267 [Saprolegnia parasitica CBS 223.65]|eukprot:XP_012194879.1 hypothetical protein SPRG_01267 [Saprolegnia parasitica CBS 223.65]
MLHRVPYSDVVLSIPILRHVAKTIPWETLLQLLTARHFILGQKVLAAGSVPHEIYFVVEGQFALRSADAAPQHVCDPGSVLCAHATLARAPLPYDIVAVRYKSTLLSICKTKFKTVLKQADAEAWISSLASTDEATVENRMTERLPTKDSATETVPIEYDLDSAMLVLHEPLNPTELAAAPVTNPACLQAKANRARRLESLHVAEQYNVKPLATTPSRRRSSPLVTKEKPVGRLLRPLEHDPTWFRNANGHVVVHARRDVGCELRQDVTSPDVPAPGRFMRLGKAELTPMHLHIHRNSPLQVPLASHLSLPSSLEQSQRPCQVPVVLAPEHHASSRSSGVKLLKASSNQRALA